MYKDTNLGSEGFTGLEKKVLETWKKNQIIEQNFKMNKGNNVFTFFDGPPTANGMPHAGHILTRVIKDIIPRYQVMKGNYVIRKAGWDTHGLPVELEIEKKLGISGKQEIEDYGVEKFIKECKESVFKYVNIWEEMSEKVGYWVDMENPYITYKNDYIESVWWALRQLHDKKLLYKGHKIMPYCSRCGTALSSHEVGQGYKDVKDLTAVVKFKLENETAENGNPKYILAWTTTPWTLPANVLLAVNKKYDYVEVKVVVSDSEEEKDYENYILAKDLVETVLKGKEYEIVSEFKGEELVSKKYEQFMPFVSFEGQDGIKFEVVHGDFVNLSDGTGIVHIAPAFGEDDSILSKANNAAFVNPVDKEGKFVDEVTPWKGRFVRDTNDDICEYLKEENKLFKAEKHLHSYPHCWRCDTPLLYYPKASWFVAMSTLRDKLVEENNKVNWRPETIKTGRFGNFLENVIDWGISRDRYWGTPLNVWLCKNEGCDHMECIGSIKELKEKAINCSEDIELHKPYIDEVKLKCEKCGSEMEREKEVLDCWFDSGSMPFAQWHYPFENKEIFEQNFPAQFISEAIDQTRGWFYTLTALGVAIFGKIPFENCTVLGHVLDGKGQKMSKSKKNGVDPLVLLDTVGADAVRWYFYNGSQPWISSRLSIENVRESQRGFLSTLWNTYSFYVLYANIDKFNPSEHKNFKVTNVMDKWILSKLNTLIKEVDEKLADYDINKSTVLIDEFTDELSNWYIRRNRKRFWEAGMEEDKVSAYMTLYTVLKGLIQVAAPFVPFMTEEIYQNIVRTVEEDAKESIHLNLWPEYNAEMVDKELEKEMDLAYSIVKLGRNARSAENIKNRQPLSKMLVSAENLPEYYERIIKEELNIKEVVLGADMTEYVNFDIKPNLPVLGKVYGKLIPQIKQELAKLNQVDLANDIKSGKDIILFIEETEVVLNESNLLVTMKGKENTVFAGENTLGIILHTEITEELREEGYVRELISKIQNTRKESGFEVVDRIKVYVNSDEELKQIITKFEEQIKESTLANEIVFEEKEKMQEIKVNDKKIDLLLEKM